MDEQELLRRIAEADLYRGAIPSPMGKLQMEAVMAYLLFGKVAVPQRWTQDRQILAAKQLVCTRDGIDAGAIDGLMGPATREALADYAERAGGPTAAIPERDQTLPAAPASVAAKAWPRQDDAEAFYGTPGAHQVKLDLPFPMRIAWDQGKTVSRISVHEKVHDSALRAFTRIGQTFDERARAELGLDLFGGCLNVRKMRGGTKWSMHSWGIAIDFDPDRNQLRWDSGKARLARADAKRFFEIWEEEGWLPLGRARNFDWMHVQAARL
jgi:hypothetical protein